MDCTSTGYGGAITSNSSLATTLRGIMNSNFTNCSGIEDKGNDFADINLDSSIIKIYDISNIDSSSDIIRFYFKSLDASLDYIFDGLSDGIGIVFVSSTGYDYGSCGMSETNPCETVDYGWDTRLDVSEANLAIYICNGMYGMRIRGNASYDLRFEGITDSTDEDNYPIIYCSSITDGAWFDITNSVSQEIGFKKLKLLYPSTNFTGYFFYISNEVNIINISDCYVVSNSTDIHCYLIKASSGYVNVVNTTFHTHTFDNYGIAYEVYALESHLLFVNCVFHSILTSGSHSLLTSSSGNEIFLSVINCVFKDLEIDGSGTEGAIIDAPVGPNNIISDNLFENIVSKRSCLVFRGESNYVVSTLTFMNVTCSSMGGGAVNIAIVNPSYSYSFVFCTFILCNSVNYYGGGFFFLFVELCTVYCNPSLAIYSSGATLLLSQCKFYDNTAYNNIGSDIYVDSYEGLDRLELIIFFL
jgi:hypothetical protein